jgi:hypothetical protein
MTTPPNVPVVCVEDCDARLLDVAQPFKDLFKSARRISLSPMEYPVWVGDFE